jgi:osmotically-inducible protein OsmY
MANDRWQDDDDYRRRAQGSDVEWDPSGVGGDYRRRDAWRSGYDTDWRRYTGRDDYSNRGGGDYRDRNYYADRGYSDRNEWGGERGWWDRTKDEVRSWMGDEEAELRRQTLDHRGRGPKGYTRTDDRIREDVCERLTEDWGVDASDIEVVVAAGHVTLSGTVDGRQSKRRAEDIAAEALGVRDVQNNLRVRTSSTYGSTSAESTLGTTSSPATTTASGTTGVAGTGTSSTTPRH